MTVDAALPAEPLYTPAGTTTDTSMLLTGLPTGKKIVVEVRAVDTSGNASDWQTALTLLTASDGAPPPVPQPPTLTARLGGVEVRWARLSSDGGELPPDFSEIEVHAGPTATFLPTEATLRGTMIGATGFFTGLAYGETTWFRLIMVDLIGNRSEPSQAVQVVAVPLVSNEIGLAAIIEGNIAPGAVRTDKLTVGALGDGMLLNGGFEETTTSGAPVGWLFESGGNRLGASYAVDTTLPKQGSRSIRMRTGAGGYAAISTISLYPVEAGEWYYSAAHFRGSQGTATPYIVWFDSARGRIGDSGGTSVQLSAAWRRADNVAQAPPGASFARVQLDANPSTAGTDVWVDAADLRHATGEAQILNAAITSAKIAQLAVQRANIANLAVGDAQIGSLTVDKLVAGELSAAYVTVTGRLTSRPGGGMVGARWELDQGGFRAYRADGVQTVGIGSDGNAFFSGRLASGTEISGATVTGGTVTGANIVGGTVRTASNGAHIELSGGGFGLLQFHQEPRQGQSPYIAGSLSGGRQTLSMFSGSPVSHAVQIVSSDFGTENGQVLMQGGGGEILLQNGGARYVARSGHRFYGGGVYDDDQRVYSPNNPPPPPSPISHNHPTTDQLIDNSFLSVGADLFIAGYRNYFHRIAYTGIYDGPAIYGNANSCAVYVFGWNNAQTPVAYGGGDGRWRMNAMAVGGAAKSFVIDHPVEPGRYLVHAAVEGPTADVFYRGQGRCEFVPHADPLSAAQGEGHGVAVVRLPDYFEALTLVEGRTVQITPMFGCDDHCRSHGCALAGSPAEDLIAPTMAAGLVRDGQFVVRTTGGFLHHCARFYWEVKAVRRDVTMDVEPARSSVVLRGDGPYTYLQPATQILAAA